MVTRFWTGSLTIALLAAQSCPAAASRDEYSIDSCAVLARIIYTEVQSAARFGPGSAGPWRIQGGEGDIEVCEHAAKTVSRAFTSAWLNAGVTVRWNHGEDYAKTFCRGEFLSRCDPEFEPVDATTLVMASKKVESSWTIVAQTVMDDMYNPFSSDIVSFRADDLKLRLGLLLRSIGALGDH